MREVKTILSKLLHAARMEPPTQDPRQRHLMVGSLALLVLALIIVLWRNADFWFPDTPAVESAGPVAGASANRSITNAVADQPRPTPRSITTKPRHSSAANHITRNQPAQNAIAQNAAAFAPVDPSTPDPPPVSISPRTVLPPLEVEVVAGDNHRNIRPGSNSVRVEMQPEMPAPAPEPGNREDETAATVTAEAADRVQLSESASQIVSEPVRPDYPLLARQMKVQGSVILDALIARDGAIQNLRVVSGPRILASAAEDAVRQWRFKPHFEGSEAVETQTRITVNFTISTN